MCTFFFQRLAITVENHEISSDSCMHDTSINAINAMMLLFFRKNDLNQLSVYVHHFKRGNQRQSNEFFQSTLTELQLYLLHLLSEIHTKKHILCVNPADISRPFSITINSFTLQGRESLSQHNESLATVKHGPFPDATTENRRAPVF